MTQKFRALKPLKVGDRVFWIGEVFTIPDDRDWQSIIRLGLAELTTTVAAEEKSAATDKNNLTIAQEYDSIPQIVKAGPVWKRVMLGDQQIGKSVKTDEEAQEIIDNWLKENSIESN